MIAARPSISLKWFNGDPPAWHIFLDDELIATPKTLEEAVLWRRRYEMLTQLASDHLLTKEDDDLH